MDLRSLSSVSQLRPPMNILLQPKGITWARANECDANGKDITTGVSIVPCQYDCGGRVEDTADVNISHRNIIQWMNRFQDHQIHRFPSGAIFIRSIGRSDSIDSRWAV